MPPVSALALTATVAAAVWLAIIVVFHFTRPNLDPRLHMISEYAREPGGWLMQLAFFSVALSASSLAAAAWSREGPAGPVLLAVCGFGFVGAGVFVTDPVLLTERAQTRSGGLHVAFAFLVIALFPVAATVTALGLGGSWRSWPVASAGLTWIGLLGFVAPALARPGAPSGLAQRFMVLTNTVWLMATGLSLAR